MRTSSGRFRFAARALLLAYLPVLTFFGHWPLNVAIPGTSVYVGLPDPGRDAHGGHDHAQHCHADASSCSDVPFAASATVALLARSVALPACSDGFVPLAGACWLPGTAATVTPDAPPPRPFMA